MPIQSTERIQFEADHTAGRLGALKSLNFDHAQALDVLDLTILAHCLSGNFAQGRWFAEMVDQRKIVLRPEQQAAILFSLAVAWTRLSEYDQARRTIARLFPWRRANHRGRFFSYQALGFFHFFTGNFARSRRYAERALKATVQYDFPFGRMLAEELFGLSSIEAGEVRLGLRHLRSALQVAETVQNPGWAASYKLHILLNEAEHSVDSKTVTHLEQALKEFHPDEHHSRNAVKLELANQLTLRGRATEAKTILDAACDSVYSSQNRRQIAQLNFRLSFLIYLKGNSSDALHLLRSSSANLNPKVDRVWIAKMRGLHSRIESGARPVRWHVQSETGNDPLGDLYEKILDKDPDALKETVRRGLYYFLLPYFDLEAGAQLLGFDLIPRGMIVVDRGNVNVCTRGFSNTLRRVIEVLAVGYVSKAELVEQVWGYEYDPSRHDTLIYTTISKIRAWLGEASHWIENDARGYRLTPSVKVLSAKLRDPEAQESIPHSWASKIKSLRQLNPRALKIVAWLDQSTELRLINAQEVVLRFKVSRATATRDLNSLVKLGLLNKFGNARATYYTKEES